MSAHPLQYLALGLVSGFVAGLLGVGGGLLMVPVLLFIFSAEGFAPDHVLLFALATSLAVIMFTSLSSVRAHHQHAAVDWLALCRISPGIVSGTLLGAWLATLLPPTFLHYFFVAFLFYAATQMLLNIKPKAHRGLPGTPGMLIAGNVIGIVSSWVGIGGGTLSVPFLLWCNTKMHTAIGTSAAIGFPIAVAGSVGYMLSGWTQPNLPAWSLGYVYLPALVLVAGASILTAPLGARAAHRLPVATLKKIFAILLYSLGIKMALSLT
jgi:uncharacterized membrane protein YfcA